jgi:hypothetical protein
VSLVRQYALSCDTCHVTVGWSPTALTAREERSAAGWQRIDGRDVCATCVAEAVTVR